MSRPPAPDALMLLTGSCPHCPGMMRTLTELLKQGWIGRLEAINLDRHPEQAEQYGARSVPWVRIGPFELPGVRGREELLDWIERAGKPDGMADYFHYLLRDGHLSQVIQVVRRQPEALAALLPIVANPEASINVRIGAGAVFEEFAGQPPMQALVERFGELARSEDARVRADACHYLGLTGSPKARDYLLACRQDDDSAVREIAAESLEAMGG